MLRLMTVLNGMPHFSEPSILDLEDQVRGADWFWLDVDSVDYEPVEEIGRLFALNRIGLDDVHAVTEFPKADNYDDHVFFSSHSPAIADDRVTTAELDGFLSDGYLITFHRTPIPGVEWTYERLLQADAFSALRPDMLLAGILEAAIRRSLQLVDGLETQIGDLESRSVVGDPSVVGLVQAFRRDAIILRRVLAPERDMVRSLMHEGMPGVDERTRRRLDSVYDDCYRVVESLDMARALLASVLETYRGAVAERTNEVMKVLTVFTVIILPLSLLAGIYGMNFSNMPELQWPWAYFALLAVMLTVVLGLWVYFSKRGFIGGPRLPRVDRVVGRGLAGLFHLTTTPVREVVQWLVDDPDRKKP
ncbi:MAG: magnesium/cobalt transporter CorA [Acidimicrobiia bacterium]|nr:magnesium/cobalt transporter CorA [Acidimicrobiia bacterium]MDH3396662.1 magnesium/cobalt transporter CorA [Acidimicrobiia bacterium]